MAKTILLEEFHVSVFLPAALPKTAFASARRNLNGQRFQTRLRDAIADLFREHPSLKSVKLNISR